MKLKSKPLKGQIAIVTGSSRNIGAQIALTLAENGADVVINFIQNKSAAKKIVDKIKKTGAKAISIQADIGKTKDIKKLFDQTQKKLGTPNILVNNSGLSLTKNIESVSEADFSRLINTNIKGTYFATKEAIKCMPEGGKIINIGSSVLNLLISNFSLYALTKAAIEGFTRAIASEAGAKKISVNMISPGPTNSEMFDKAHTQEEKDFLTSQIAFGRIGTYEDIGSAVLSLSLPTSSWITGQSIFANGGFI